MKANGFWIDTRALRYIAGAALICLALLFACINVCAAEDYAVTEMQLQGEITTDSTLNVRSGPGTGYSVIDKVDSDTLLTITGQADNGWYQVEIDGVTGYVSDQYVNAVEAAEEEEVELDEEEGEPEEGYRGLNQSPYVIKMSIIVAVILVIIVLIIFTLRGLRKDNADDDDGDGDDEYDEDDYSDGDDEYDEDDYSGGDEEDDEDDYGDGDEEGDEDDRGDDDEEDGDSGAVKAGAGRRASQKRSAKKGKGGSDGRSGKREYVLREEDYRVQIDPSFFEEKEPIEQPAMVTGYLERKKIEEAAVEAEKREKQKSRGAERENQSARDLESPEAEKQQELDQAMAKLNELQKEIERLKQKE